MNKPVNMTAVLLVALTLGACGGGSGGGSAPITVITAPVATPTPTPTPAPTPTPTPAASDPLAGYGTGCDGFASAKMSFAISANMDVKHSDRSTTVPDAYIYSSNKLELANYGDGLSFVYEPRTRTAKTVHLIPGGFDREDVYSFAEGDVVDSSYSRISYANGTKSLVVTCEPGSSIFLQRYSADLRNPALGVASSVFRYQISGSPTVDKDPLVSASYTSNLSGETFRTDVQDPARRTEAFSNQTPVVLSFDAKAGTLSGRMRLVGSEPIDLEISIDTMIGTRFHGTVVGSNGTKGEIIGGFYGPGAREIGYTTTFEKFGIHYAGAGHGVRN
jgi:hypothetical protein